MFSGSAARTEPPRIQQFDDSAAWFVCKGAQQEALLGMSSKCDSRVIRPQHALLRVQPALSDIGPLATATDSWPQEATMRERDDALSNPSANPSFESVLAARYSRRQVLTGGLVAAATALLGAGSLRPAPAPGTGRSPRLPECAGVQGRQGDRAARVHRGGPLRLGRPHRQGPAFRPDASNTIADQELQAGMHHDAVHYFALPWARTAPLAGYWS